MLCYTEDRPEVLRIPKDNPGIPTPHELGTAQAITLAGEHVDQYYKCHAVRQRSGCNRRFKESD